MFNSFPQPRPDSGGGLPSLLDWSAYQTVYDLTGTSVFVPASSWGTFVDITGKGFFKWCRMIGNSSGNSHPSIRITIDGQAYTFDTSNAGTVSQGNEVNFEIPFKTSLKIEGQNRIASADNVSCDYLYLLQRSNPNPNKITLLQQSQRKMGYLSTVATTLTDVVNIAGSGYLLGARYLARYGTGAWNVAGSITVDGVQKMPERFMFDVSADETKFTEVIGPIRFTSSLRVQTRATSATSTALCFVWYSLD